MRTKFGKPKAPPGLMLTSLLDMFTIILIFLIVNFKAEDHNFELNDQIELPMSTSRSPFKSSIGVTVTRDSIMVGKEVVLQIDPDGLPRSYFDDGKIPELVARLETDFAAVTKEQQCDPEVEVIVLVQADKDLDYNTLYLVLRSTSIAGFSKYRMATMKQ